MVKVVINSDWGGYSLSKRAYEQLGIEWKEDSGFAFYDDRSNPDLVKVVEELGNLANGDGASLKVVEVPDDINWEIGYRGGKEWVEEVGRTWY